MRLSGPDTSGRSIIDNNSPAIQKRFSWVNIAQKPYRCDHLILNLLFLVRDVLG